MLSLTQKQNAVRIVFQLEQAANAAMLIIDSELIDDAEDNDESLALREQINAMTGKLAETIQLLADNRYEDAQASGADLLAECSRTVAPLLQEQPVKLRRLGDPLQ